MAALSGLRLIAARPISAIAWMLLLAGGLAGSMAVALHILSLQSQRSLMWIWEPHTLFALGSPILAPILTLLVGAIYRSVLTPEARGFAFIRIGQEELALFPWVLAMTSVLVLKNLFQIGGPPHYVMLAGLAVVTTPVALVGPAIFSGGYRKIARALTVARREWKGLLLMQLAVTAIYVAYRWPTGWGWATLSRATREAGEAPPVWVPLTLGQITLVGFTLWLVLSASAAAQAYQRLARAEGEPAAR